MERLSLIIFAAALMLTLAAVGVRSCKEASAASASVPEILIDSAAIQSESQKAKTDSVPKKKTKRGRQKQPRPASPPRKPASRDYPRETL